MYMSDDRCGQRYYHSVTKCVENYIQMIKIILHIILVIDKSLMLILIIIMVIMIMIKNNEDNNKDKNGGNNNDKHSKIKCK